MTYSIAYGLIAGIITYIVLNTSAWIIEKLSGGRIVPFAKEISDPWTYKIEGGILPGWVMRLCSGKKDFWRPHHHEIERDMADAAEREAVEERKLGSNSPEVINSIDTDEKSDKRS